MGHSEQGNDSTVYMNRGVMLFRGNNCLPTIYSALASSVFASELWFIFTYETDFYIGEYMVSQSDMLLSLTNSP